ncbi:GTP cyclohydrolase I FolE [Aliifodinibius sp. S!AR15-10]|uniref:GTP cyclohydrolase I FolE n=1 Tax=Aliifodinibius sp. S!AR15-10 TaxID=2950437 RepID=UPI0028582303|nr:GTP cyclohydrolase I FolE [Aliifodinibius sp. S!AR15-10]MDR8389944.1 GTP cyclohydrolase I FolE [Aliifodinibius sp. S!AR15-10]
MEAISKNIDKSFDDLTENEKIEHIQFYFLRIMQVLGLNLNDSSLKDTPQRVAQMYVNEIFNGLNENSFPKMTVFENDYGYDQMLIEKDITLYSYCAHHFVPIIGRAHVAYYPSDYVVGLSKINRLVQHFAQKPQVQEKLTMEIADALKESLHTDDIAVFIEADHLCVASRGIKDTNSTTQTSFYGGKFKQDQYKREFLESMR